MKQTSYYKVYTFYNPYRALKVSDNTSNSIMGATRINAVFGQNNTTAKNDNHKNEYFYINN